MKLKVLIMVMIYEGLIKQTETMIEKNVTLNEIKYNELEEHAVVTDGVTFPFMAAILMRSKFLSAGALIEPSWVLTAADSVYLIREASRTVRVRLGSINYRKGGIVVPVKYIVIHPYFDDETPGYDLALIRLPEPVRETPTLKSIKMQMFMQEPDGAHFIVPSWPDPMLFSESSESELIKSTELIKRLRLLSVTYLHPLDSKDCKEDLASIGVNTATMMCLDTEGMVDPCSRDFGAPVVLNGLLWGILSTWTIDDCNSYAPISAYVSLVSVPNITTWIYSTVHGLKWKGTEKKVTNVIHGAIKIDAVANTRVLNNQS
ncbi:hypothetical protein PYW08_009382 [Mythimna loreyi]|uniref:Uncharacterized protein n=1 Tax=Mythimna loreyi TaxID=667449 RepID=A0ACC2Q909_9NEOP|nr:hypothetical protein PYW08_009382 [Mythimna loreyi]